MAWTGTLNMADLRSRIAEVPALTRRWSAQRACCCGGMSGSRADDRSLYSGLPKSLHRLPVRRCQSVCSR